MEKTRLYLIRHGKTEWNAQARYQGRTDIDLCEEGFEQAKLVGERFKNISIDRLISSPLIRAIHTAEPISKATGAPIETDDRFIEIDFGEWEGQTISEIRQRYGKEYDDFFGNPFKYPCPGEGTYADVSVRVAQGINDILKQSKGKNVAIISHGGLLRLLIIRLLNLSGEFYHKSWLDNTSLSILDIYEDGRTVLSVLNDHSHLPN